ncbi:mediator of RNA polymerase II transcription subunit 23-like isoform X2 [Oscarella lobularis]|uniref:mediator of RNA polymerase II transcription subunit 23-like isoform X2 n=1 Tax=Oscarella lobularis TaxID=121494 RepID=UPI0033143F57
MSVESVPLDDATQKEVKRILNYVFDSSALEKVLGNILLPLRSQESIEERALSELKSVLMRIQPESCNDFLGLLFDFAVSQQNVQRLIFGFNLLVKLAEINVVPYQFVFDLLVDRLNFDDTIPWMETFNILLANISKADYRVCRELLVRVLANVSACPIAIHESKIPQIQIAKDFVSRMLSREGGLLPGYSAYSAVAKRFPEASPSHWIFEDMWEKFRNSFLQLADLVSMPGRLWLRPVVGYSPLTGAIWKVDPNTLQFIRRPNNVLRFNKEESQAQIGLLTHALTQPSSRELVSCILSLSRQNRQRCVQLEHVLVDLIFEAFESFEDTSLSRITFTWNHLCSQSVFFALFQFANLSNLIARLTEKLSSSCRSKRGRDWLMWLLLQIVSPSLQKLDISSCESIYSLLATLYSDKEAMVPLPDFSSPSSSIHMAAACLWNHLQLKYKLLGKPSALPTLPAALKLQTDFFTQDRQSLLSFSQGYHRYVIVCNAYGGVPDTLNSLAARLIDSWMGSPSNTVPMPSPSSNLVMPAGTQSCTFALLKSLSTNIRMNLLATINQRLTRAASSQPHVVISPAVLEAYSRLIIYMETDYGVAVKTLTGQVLPLVYQQQNLSTLHSLVEVMSFRLQRHISVNHKVHLVSMLYQMSSIANYQLQLSIETSVLKFLSGLVTPEFPSQLLKLLNDPRMSMSQLLHMEELNKMFVFTLAKSMRLAGLEGPFATWPESILRNIQRVTPHSWPSYISDKMPYTLRNYYVANAGTASSSPLDQKSLLQSTVADDWAKWKTSGIDETHFSRDGGTSTFLCILWKTVVDEGKLPPNVYRILEKISVKESVCQVRMLADYITAVLASTWSTEGVKDQFNKSLGALNELIWKYKIIPLERFVLCMLMRNASGNDASVQISLLSILLTSSRELKERITVFLQEGINPEHWKHEEWFSKNGNLHKAYPEYMYFEGLQGQNPSQKTYLPTYFGNFCLRFIPILELMVNRCFEMYEFKATLKFFDRLMDVFGGLYRYHDRPVMSIYTLLHYYDQTIGLNYAVKKKLVGSTLGHEGFQPSKEWLFTRSFCEYLSSIGIDPIFGEWIPDSHYFTQILTRLQSVLNNDFPAEYLIDDWRFREFGAPTLHVLYCTAVEVMSLPLSAKSVCEYIIDVALEIFVNTRDVTGINAAAVLLATLPESYWSVLNERMLQCIPEVTIDDDDVVVGEEDERPAAKRPRLEDDRETEPERFGFNQNAAVLLRLVSAFWYHTNNGQLTRLVGFLENAASLVRTETQLLFVFRLTGPLLTRFQTERTSCLLDVALGLYRMLKLVDDSGGLSRHLDLISDFLYYIKYSFIGDAGKDEIKTIIGSLNPESSLYHRLRFMA